MERNERMGRGGHPIFGRLADDGRNLLWLSRRIGFSHSHVRNVKAGQFPPSARFRAACAAAMGLPEADLFLHSDDSSAGRAEEVPDTGSDRRAGFAAHRAYSPDQEAAIVRLA